MIEVQKRAMVLRVIHSVWGVCLWEFTCGKVIFLFTNEIDLLVIKIVSICVALCKMLHIHLLF